MDHLQKLQEAFGNHLRKLREDRGLSLRDLATRSDLHYNKIGQIELGKTNLKLSSIIALAEGLEIEPKELLNFNFQLTISEKVAH
ncbi:helix-turn-helix transcriptional regulator [Mucilaginibacter sp. PAMB04168]|uniref:helix-turn-helix domain-containing protein n=1 Tax=Mucilaginibacter sp. PAMB04168 TaxID=3138567 RepID=UPI00331BC7A9